MAVSRQATNLGKERIRLNAKFLTMERESSKQAAERIK